ASFGGEHDRAFAPMSVTVTLEDEVELSGGDLLVHPRNQPRAQANFEAMMVWMAEEAMQPDRPYILKHTTRTTKASIQKIEYRIDVNTLSRMPPAPLALNEIGRVVLHSTRTLLVAACAQNRATRSFLLTD